MISTRNVLGLALVVPAAGLVAGALFVLQGDSADHQASAAQPRTAASLVVTLRRTRSAPREAKGTATITDRASGKQVKVVAGGLAPASERRAYEVWLYNSRRDAVSIGATLAPHGRFKGAGDLPASFASYRYLDVSLEKIDRHREHDGRSVLRGKLP